MDPEEQRRKILSAGETQNFITVNYLTIVGTPALPYHQNVKTLGFYCTRLPFAQREEKTIIRATRTNTTFLR